jgi:transcriptional regulator with XRE-family HTH domain
MNKLLSHLTENGITQADFAAQIGVTQATVSKFCSGDIAPRPETAQKIARATGGKVPVESWPNIAALISALKTDAA